MKAELARRGRTQGQLAECLGMTEAVISNKFNGKYGYKPFTLEECVKICDFLGMSPTGEVLTYLFVGGNA